MATEFKRPGPREAEFNALVEQYQQTSGESPDRARRYVCERHRRLFDQMIEEINRYEKNNRIVAGGSQV